MHLLFWLCLQLKIYVNVCTVKVKYPVTKIKGCICQIFASGDTLKFEILDYVSTRSILNNNFIDILKVCVHCLTDFIGYCMSCLELMRIYRWKLHCHRCWSGWLNMHHTSTLWFLFQRFISFPLLPDPGWRWMPSWSGIKWRWRHTVHLSWMRWD
jgi:hypothetical protein